MFPSDQYELLDFGNGRKLERFGGWLLDRPSPAAEGVSRRDPSLWRSTAGWYERTTGDRGVWRWADAPPKAWTIAHGEMTLKLRPTESGHLGVFPEQAANWDWIAEQVRAARHHKHDAAPAPIRVLNLFAYTGAATFAAAAAGAEVTHVDSARTTVGWARRNAELSGLAAAPIRWIVEDAVTFVRRELKRGNRYQAVIVDPPSYGHGPNGEVWKLDEQLPELLRLCADLTVDQRWFMLLSCHSPGFDQRKLGELLAAVLGGGNVQSTEMTIAAESGHRLPSGSAARWTILPRTNPS